MKSLSRLAACAVAGSLVSLPACAQPTISPTLPAASAPSAAAATISLRAALDLAWQRAVASREADGQRRRADADRIASTKLWASAPTLELSHRDDRWQRNAGRRESEVGIAVPLWLPGQRAARAGSADAAIAQAKSAEQVARLQLAAEVREIAWEIAALQAEARQAEAQAAGLRQVANDVDRRVLAGDLARADSLAAQAESLAASAIFSDASQRLRFAQARWTLLIGLTALPELHGTPASDPSLSEVGLHPELQLARQSTDLARKRLELVRRSRREAPELTLGVRQDLPGRGQASQGSVVMGLRLPLSTDDRNRPLEEAALAELDIAQVHEQRLHERLDSEIASARAAQVSAQAQLEAATSRAGLLRTRAALIDKSFRAGETPLPDLLRALAASAEADNAVARQTAALGLARARLEQSFGLLP